MDTVDTVGEAPGAARRGHAMAGAARMRETAHQDPCVRADGWNRRRRDAPRAKRCAYSLG